MSTTQSEGGRGHSHRDGHGDATQDTTTDTGTGMGMGTGTVTVTGTGTGLLLVVEARPHHSAGGVVLRLVLPLLRPPRARRPHRGLLPRDGPALLLLPRLEAPEERLCLRLPRPHAWLAAVRALRVGARSVVSVVVGLVREEVRQQRDLLGARPHCANQRGRLRLARGAQRREPVGVGGPHFHQRAVRDVAAEGEVQRLEAAQQQPHHAALLDLDAQPGGDITYCHSLALINTSGVP